jgi:Ca2+-binding RTX toxin-like protein
MTSPLHRHSGRRLGAATFAVAIVAALTLGPAAASFADDIEGPDGPSVIEGTPNDDDITGDNNDSGTIAFVPGDDDVINGGAGNDDIVGDGVADGDIAGSVGDPISGERSGDDTINGGEGDDRIAGDGFAGGLAGGTIVGGHDTVHGDGGNDLIYGDGLTEGLVGGVVDGGDDILYGDDGDDEIYGDGFVDSLLGLDIVIGGDDELYGGAGEDYLDGQGGNDLLCGLGGGQENTEADGDTLIGGEGSDLACAVDDDVTAAAGVQDSIMVGLNDEVLDDEGDEDGILQYTLGAITGGILNAVLDALTGELTFTAECDGTVGYSVTRDDVEASELVTNAVVNIDVTNEAAACHPVTDTPDRPATDTVDDAAVLPDTGASGGLNAIGVSGLGLVVGGIAMIVVASRRKVQPVGVNA